MSFLQEVQKVSGARYVLPKIGAMRTEVHAYLSETLFAQTDEVLRVLEAEGIAKIAHRMYPVANIKRTD